MTFISPDEPNSLRWPRLYTAELSRQIDAAATAGGDPDGYRLMCRAGRSLAREVHRRWPDRPVSILCGAGNNAGDGYVLARELAAAGASPQVIYVVDPAGLSGEAGQAVADFLAAGLSAEAFDRDGTGITGEVLVDALLGTGLTREVSGAFAAAVELANRHPGPKLAVDVPSGLCADAGIVRGTAVRADVTLSFITRKRGLYTADGPDYGGQRLLDPLGVPDAVFDQFAATGQLLNGRLVRELLEPRAGNVHKGTHGRVLIVGGAPGMFGAAVLAGTAALRVGAGLVKLAVHPENVQRAAPPELMISAVADAAALAPHLDAADVVAVGPGLGTGDWGQQLWRCCLQSDRALVVDADALNLLAAEPARRDNWILTPHPGEAGRLLRRSTGAVQQDRFASAAALVAELGGTAVLKGAGTIVADAAGLDVCPLGNPGMATAGMGDVLTGTIAGLKGQRLGGAVEPPAPGAAARLGVVVHAAAGDLAARQGQRGLLAGDVVEQLRAVVNP
ncbi:MAG: NAD(P)H-hydrate dehydratase [Pseudomonadota bacterium]